MRPEGWDDQYPHPCDTCKPTIDGRCEKICQAKIEWLLIEAGADAMLEGLKQEGIWQEVNDPVLHYEEWHGRQGWIVFIEDNGNRD